MSLPENYRQLATSIRATQQSGISMREVLAAFAKTEGIPVEAAEIRVEVMRRRLFPDVGSDTK